MEPRLIPKYCRFLFIKGVLLVFFLPVAVAQQTESKKIELIQANSLEYDESKGIKARRLIGEVIFKHEEVFLYCDSAWLFAETNSLDAYSNVYIKQGDTMNLYGDTLYYDGNTKMARVRGNIRMEENEMVLTTNYLNYNRNDSVAYYWGGGELVSNKEKNTLTSEKGYYYPNTKSLFFKDSVKLVNPDYTITSDTLMYNTENEITYFYGPSTIVSEDNFIYCENGWYDTERGLSQFSHNAYIISDKRRMEGDSIIYNQEEGIGEAFGNVAMTDTIQDIILNGDYAIYYERDSISLITGNAMLTQFDNKDSLFLHADTLFATYDSTRKHRMMHAWYKVRFFREDMQGKCDSLVFSDVDSTIRMYEEPVIWSDDNQITADYLEIKRAEGEVKSMIMQNNAFIAMEEDTNKHNQIKGVNMEGFFKDNKLKKINVYENGATVYYAREDNGDMIGVNRADCENMVIRLDSNQVKQVTFLTQPTATLFPIDKVEKSKIMLAGFRWLNAIRPKKKEDIFIWKELPELEGTVKRDLGVKKENPVDQ